MAAEEPTKMIAEEEKPLTKKISPGTGRGLRWKCSLCLRSFSLFQFLFLNFLFDNSNFIYTPLCMCTGVAMSLSYVGG